MQIYRNKLKYLQKQPQQKTYNAKKSIQNGRY